MIGEARVVVTPVLRLTPDLPFITQPISLFHRIWPAAFLAAAGVVTLVWIGFLGYAVFKLAELAFS